MKKFNNEMYKEIKKNGYYEDQYYKYIVIDKKIVFKGWKSNWLSSLKYEFYGVLDTEKKDVFTLDNVTTLQNEFTEEAKKEILKEILKNYNYYLDIQKNKFNEKIQNEEFKRSILYYYIDRYTDNFRSLYIKGVKVEELKDEILNNLIDNPKNENEEIFLKIYLEDKKENIIAGIKEKIKNNIDEWAFNYNWQNGIPEDQKIDVNFNNLISLRLNKMELILEEYKKLYDNPMEYLKKAKKLYKLCKDFKEKNDNKTCYIYLKNDTKLKCIDFDYLITILEQGNEKAISYRLLTGPERYQLEKFNEEQGRGTREDDLFIEDIKKIEFNKNIIYKEA